MSLKVASSYVSYCAFNASISEVDMSKSASSSITSAGMPPLSFSASCFFFSMFLFRLSAALMVVEILVFLRPASITFTRESFNFTSWS